MPGIAAVVTAGIPGISVNMEPIRSLDRYRIFPQGDSIMMLSKTLKTALAGLALSLALPMTQASARDLVVATDTAFVPFEFKQDGKYTGFDVQLWEAIAK